MSCEAYFFFAAFLAGFFFAAFFAAGFFAVFFAAAFFAATVLSADIMVSPDDRLTSIGQPEG